MRSRWRPSSRARDSRAPWPSAANLWAAPSHWQPDALRPPMHAGGSVVPTRHRLDRSSTMVIAAYYTAVLRFPHRARPRIGPKGSTGCLPRKCRFNLRELLSSPSYRLLPPNNPRILSAKRSTAGSSSLTPRVASCWPIRWLTASKGFARRNCSDNSSNTDT